MDALSTSARLLQALPNTHALHLIPSTKASVSFLAAKPLRPTPTPCTTIRATVHAVAPQLTKQQSHSEVQLSVQQFYLPLLQCSFPPKRHPDYNRISVEVDSWLMSWMPPQTDSEKKLLLQTDIAGVGYYMYPDTVNSDRLLLVSKFIAWINNFDNIIDESHHASAADIRETCISPQIIREALENHENLDLLTGRPELDAILSLSKQLRADMTNPRHYMRHVESTMKSLSAALSEANLRQKHGIPDLASFIPTRRNSIGFDHMQLMLEYCLGIELNNEILQMESVKELHAAAADFIAWTNDVLSFRKEYFNGDFQNLPCVVYFENKGQGGFQKAINTACRMMGDRECDFRFLLHEISLSDVAASIPQFRLYLRSLPYLLSGHLEWCYTTAAYHGVDNQMNDLRHGWLHMDPLRTIIKRMDFNGLTS